MPRAGAVLRRDEAPSCSLGVRTARLAASRFSAPAASRLTLACRVGARRPRINSRMEDCGHRNLFSTRVDLELSTNTAPFEPSRPFAKDRFDEGQNPQGETKPGRNGADHSGWGRPFRCPSQWDSLPCSPRYARCTVCHRSPLGSCAPNLARQRRMCWTSKQRCVLLVRL